MSRPFLRASKRHAPVHRHRWRVDGGGEHASCHTLERRRGGRRGVVGGGIYHGELLKVARVRRSMQTGTKAVRLVAHHHVLALTAIEHAWLKGHVVVVGLVIKRLV